LKRIGLIIVILLAIVVTGITIFTYQNKDSLVLEKHIKEAETENQTPEEEQTETNEESESMADKIAQTVTEVVESAVTFFTDKDLKIVAIGDSLTQGVGDDSNNEGYVGFLEDKLKKPDNSEFEIDNFGKRGNRTDQLLKRLDEQEIIDSIKKANIILVTIGANDIMKIVKANVLSLSYDDFTVEQKGYQARLNNIFSKIRQQNPYAHIYLIGLYNPFDQYFGHIPELDKILDDWNWIGREVVKANTRSTFIPIKDLFDNTEENLFYEDNFHPNARGYELIGQRVFDFLRETYGKPNQ
jgi:lysophospholipase L1-like esterase